MQRIRRVGFGVISLAPVENQIRGKENELDFRRQFRQQLRDFHIHAPRELRIFLRLADGADGRAVDDELRLVFLKFPADGGEIKQVKIRRASTPARASAGQISARSGQDNFQSARSRR